MRVLPHLLVAGVVLAGGIALGRYAIPSRHLEARPVEAEAAATGPAPRRWEATVYLPLADNAGQPFAEGAWQEALEALVVPFGGATLDPPREGCWAHARRP